MKFEIIATFSVMLVIFLERAFPFILFSRKEPPAFISFIEKYIPPMVMICLVIYCLKDVNFVTPDKNIDLKGFIPPAAGVISTVLLHLWKKNSLISIFGATLIYMVVLKLI